MLFLHFYAMEVRHGRLPELLGIDIDQRTVDKSIEKKVELHLRSTPPPPFLPFPPSFAFPWERHSTPEMW